MNIFQTMLAVCRENPQILIFLSLAIGYYIGKISIKGFQLGSTASVLLVALVLGQINVVMTPLIETVSFALFIFTIGYKVGPHFFGGLKSNAFKYLLLSFFVAIVGLVTAIVVGKFFGFDKGTTAGLLAGAMTQSSMIGTATDAIGKLSISAAEKSLLRSHIAVSYAVTYIFGVAGLILFYKIMPIFLKIDLKKEAQLLQSKLSVGPTESKKQSSVEHAQAYTYVTNIITLGLGCFLGTLVGLITIKVGVVPITLGIGGGILLVGLVFGWLQSRYAVFSPFPPAIETLLTDLGLNLFIVCVGLSAGPKAIHALQTHGLAIFFAGMLLTLMPHILGIAFGRLVLKLNYVFLFGGLSGAGTVTPVLKVLKDECRSDLPAVAYTLPYAIGNFILTVWGALIVNLM